MDSEWTEADFDYLRFVAKREKGTERGDRALELLGELGQPTLKVTEPSEAAAHMGTLARRAIDAAGLGFPERIGDRIRAIGDSSIEDVRAERYKATNKFRADHPWQAIAADVGGGVGGMLAALLATPFTGGASAATIPARLGAIANAVTGTNRWRRAATLGAAGGAVSGWNVSQEDDDPAARAKEALFDAGVGAVAGPALEAASPFIVRGAQWAGKSLLPESVFKGRGKAADRANRRVGAALQDSADDHGIDPAERAAQIKANLGEQQRGSLGSQPYRVVDAGGERFEYYGANVLMNHAGSGNFRRFLIGRQHGNPETGMLSHQQRLARGVDDAFDVELDPETGKPFTAKQLKNSEEARLTREYREAYAKAEEALKARGLDKMEVNVNRAVEALETITGRGLLHGGGQLGAKNLDRMITGLLKKLRSAKPMALDVDEAALLIDLGDGLFAAPPRAAVHEFRAAMNVARAKLKEAAQLEAKLNAAVKRQAKGAAAKDGKVSKAQAKVDAAQQAVDEASGAAGLSEEDVAALRAAIEEDEAWVASARAEMQEQASAPAEAAPEAAPAADPVEQAAAVKAGAADDGIVGEKPSETPLWSHEPDSEEVARLHDASQAAKDALVSKAPSGRPWMEPDLYEAFQRAKMAHLDAREGSGAARDFLEGIIRKAEGWQAGESAPSWAGVFGGGPPPSEHMVRGATDALAGKAPDPSHIKGKGMKANKEQYAKGHAQVSLALKLRDDYPERPPEWHAEQQRLADMGEWERAESARKWQAGLDKANDEIGDLPPDFDPATRAKVNAGEVSGREEVQTFRMLTGQNAKEIRNLREEIAYDENLIKEHTADGNTDSVERVTERIGRHQEELDEALRERQRLFMAERAVRVGGADPSVQNGDVFQIIKGQFKNVEDLSLITDPSLARTGRQGQNLGFDERQMAEWEDLQAAAPPQQAAAAEIAEEAAPARDPALTEEQVSEADEVHAALSEKTAAAEQVAADVQAMSPEDYAKANPDSHTARLINARSDLRAAEKGQSEARRALAAAQNDSADDAMLHGLEAALAESGASVKALRKEVSGLEMAERDVPVVMHELEQQRTLLARYEDELEAAGGEEADFALERVQATEKRIESLEAALGRAGVSPKAEAAEAVADDVGSGVTFKEGDGAHGLDVESTGVPHPVRTDLDPGAPLDEVIAAGSAARTARINLNAAGKTHRQTSVGSAAEKMTGERLEEARAADAAAKAQLKEARAMLRGLDDDQLIAMAQESQRRLSETPRHTDRSVPGTRGERKTEAEGYRNLRSDTNLIWKEWKRRHPGRSLNDILDGGAPEAPPAQAQAAEAVAEDVSRETSAAKPGADTPEGKALDDEARRLHEEVEMLEEQIMNLPEDQAKLLEPDVKAAVADFEAAAEKAPSWRKRDWNNPHDDHENRYYNHIRAEYNLNMGDPDHVDLNLANVGPKQIDKAATPEARFAELLYQRDALALYKVHPEATEAARAVFAGRFDEVQEQIGQAVDDLGIDEAVRIEKEHLSRKMTDILRTDLEDGIRSGAVPPESGPPPSILDTEIARREQRVGEARASIEANEGRADPKAVAAAQAKLDKAMADLEAAQAAQPPLGKSAAQDAEIIGRGDSAITGLRAEASEIERAAYEKAMATHDNLEVPNKEVYREVPQAELRPGQVLPEDTMVVQRQAARVGDVIDIGGELKNVAQREAASRSTSTRDAPWRPEFAQAAQAIRDDVHAVLPERAEADAIYKIGSQRRDAVMGKPEKGADLTGGRVVAKDPKMEAADAVAHYNAAGRAGDAADERLGTATEGDRFRANFRGGYAAGLREDILSKPSGSNAAAPLTADSRLAAAQEIAADGEALRRAVSDENEMFETTRRLSAAIPSHEGRLRGRFDMANISRGVEHIIRGRPGIGFGNLSLVDRLTDARWGAATNEAIGERLMSPDGDVFDEILTRLARDRAQQKLVSDALRAGLAPDRTGQGGFGM